MGQFSVPRPAIERPISVHHIPPRPHAPNHAHVCSGHRTPQQSVSMPAYQPNLQISSNNGMPRSVLSGMIPANSADSPDGIARRSAPSSFPPAGLRELHGYPRTPTPTSSLRPPGNIDWPASATVGQQEVDIPQRPDRSSFPPLLPKPGLQYTNSMMVTALGADIATTGRSSLVQSVMANVSQGSVFPMTSVTMYSAALNLHAPRDDGVGAVAREADKNSQTSALSVNTPHGISDTLTETSGPGLLLNRRSADPYVDFDDDDGQQITGLLFPPDSVRSVSAMSPNQSILDLSLESFDAAAFFIFERMDFGGL
ncbi:hypothetical protein BJ742DRAFT_337665 [Cladochytrium replicatum]|nr:hypothetical protein BJ742DRAFT_337665 [Cladochytrium replicatum]